MRYIMNKNVLTIVIATLVATVGLVSVEIISWYNNPYVKGFIISMISYGSWLGGLIVHPNILK